MAKTDRWGKIPLKIMSDENLTMGAKVLWACLAMHENPDSKQCNPTITQLAAASQLTRQSVRRFLQVLSKKNLITIKKDGNRMLFELHPDGKKYSIDGKKCSIDKGEKCSIDGKKYSIDGKKCSPHNNVLKEKKRKEKVPPSVDTNFADLHKKLRPVWTRISNAKYPGGELGKLARQHSETAVIDALEQIFHLPEPPRKVIPYLVVMLRDSPTPNTVSKPPADPGEYDHSHEVLISTQMANRPGGRMAIPTWGGN